MAIRIAFQTLVRAAAVDLLTDFATAYGIKLQVHRARPRSLFPPAAFVDLIGESIEYTMQLRQRDVRVEVLVVHGLFDSGDAVDQRDAFMDAFLDYVTDRIHAAHANTTLAVESYSDEPAWVPDWQPANFTNGAPAMYATRITLRGYVGDA
jgi:hypothetical protein